MPETGSRVGPYQIVDLMVEDGRKAGHTFSQPDLIIAATALQHGMTVVSRDTSEYENARVPVLNPWTS